MRWTCWPLAAAASSALLQAANPLQNLHASLDRGKGCSRITHREQTVLLLCHCICLFIPLPDTSLTFFLYHEHFSQHGKLCVIHGASVVLLIKEGSGRRQCCEAA